MYWPRREKHGFGGSRPASPGNFECVKFSWHTFQRSNNKCTDQTAQMSRLVCAFLSFLLFLFFRLNNL